MTKATATIIGFVLAPAFPAFVMAFTSPVVQEGNIVDILGGTLFFYCFALAFTVFFGVPAFALLQKLRLITWWSVIPAGLVIGSLVAIIVDLPSLRGLQNIPRMGLLGCATTFLFWLIWRLGRDKNQQSSST